jgi:hypothetical protein
MAVDYGTYEEEPGLENGGLVAESGDAWLILDGDYPDEKLQIKGVDAQPGRVRIHTLEETEDEIQYTDMTFKQFQMARLAFGLWERCGPFTQPEGNAVPIEVATSGQEAIAAYLRVGNGYPKSRTYVAEKMDVTEQTVSNYCNRVRWSP